MTFPANPGDRSPKGDHNRRLSLGLELDAFAAEAGVTPDELRAYEFTDVDGSFDAAIADRIGRTLERLEAAGIAKIDNGPSPGGETLETRVEAALHEDAFVEQLSGSDVENAELLVGSQLAEIDPAIRLVSFGERPRGPLRELLVGWEAGDGRSSETVIPLHAHAA
jgi:hypothetical protein